MSTRTKLALILGALGGLAPAHGADTAAPAEAQLAAAVAEIATLRDTIAGEKLPLAAELRELDATLLEKRRERDRLQRLRDNSGVELAALEAQLKVRTDEIAYATNLLGDYANRLNASLHPAEVNTYAEQLLTILNVAEQPELAPAARIETQADALLIGLARLREHVGGRTFAGSAVLPDGRFVAGHFALAGPLGLFAAGDGSAAGLAERGTATGPRVVEFDSSARAAIATLVQNGSATIPVDPTEGRAIALASTEETLLEHIAKGGLWMYPILGFALVALGMGVLKAVQIAGFRLPPAGVVDDVLTPLREGRVADAERVAKAQPGPVGGMLLEGVRHWRMPKELLDELMFEKLLEVKPALDRGLALISVTAAVAPLLGLLGTVTGMINTFKAITVFGTGDAKSLSSGISEALITTEYGLIVAIPALLLSAYLGRRVNGYLAGMERLSIALVNGASVIRETEKLPLAEREAAAVA